MRKLEVFERRIEILKLLQEKEMSIGELAEAFNVEDRTMRTDIDALRQGIDLFGVKFRIESKHQGKQKHYYKSTLHPIILGLNLSELFALLKVLEEKSNSYTGDVYKNIFQSIYSQISPYAEGIIKNKLEGKYERKEITALLEEEAFKQSKDYKLIYWEKSGLPIEVNYLDPIENKRITEEVKLLAIKGDKIKIKNREKNEKWIEYGEVLIDWGKVSYK